MRKRLYSPTRWSHLLFGDEKLNNFHILVINLFVAAAQHQSRHGLVLRASD